MEANYIPGLDPKPYKPRCQFGHGHIWIFIDADADLCQCSKCGCMSSNWQKEETKGVRVGQRWRQTDGYLCVVVGYAANGWPWVRHVNAKQGGHMVNPAWFSEWEMVRDA